MLLRAEHMYRQIGDTTGAAVCRQEILGLETRIREVLDSTDPLAWRIADRPALHLPPEYDNYVAAVRAGR